jgi:hypothetical protein
MYASFYNGDGRMSVHVAAQDVQLHVCCGPDLVLNMTGLV